MKVILSSLLTLVTLSSFAASTLDCSADDGSQLQAVVNGDFGSKPSQFKLRVRLGELISYPDATAALYETELASNGEEKIKLLVVKSTSKGILAVIKDNNILVDRSGTYGANCIFEY